MYTYNPFSAAASINLISYKLNVLSREYECGFISKTVLRKRNVKKKCGDFLISPKEVENVNFSGELQP